MSVIALGADTSLTPPCTVIWWNQLQENPQALYNVCSGGEDGTLQVSDDVVNLTQVNSRFTFGVGQDHSWEIKVKSSEELERLRSDLMSKPILFRATVEQARSDFYVVFAIHKNWIAELAVLVNTRHPSIREVLSSKLNEAMQSMRNGEKFCLKIYRKVKRIDKSHSFRDLLVVSQTDNIKACSKLQESFSVLSIHWN